MGLNRIDTLDNKVKLSKKQGSEASPTKPIVTSLDIDSRTILDPSRINLFIPQSSPELLERSVINEVFKGEGEGENL